MKTRKVIGGLVVAVAVAAIAPFAVSQEKKGEEGGEGMEMTPEMMAYMMPGEHHEYLEILEGKWNVTTKFWMGPDAPPSESTGTSIFKWVLGGRFLQEHFNGVGEMGPFEGIGMIGYDNHKKKYVNIWADSMGTGIMMSEGTCDDSHKVFTFHSEADDPWFGGKKKYRSVMRVINEGKIVFEMFETGKDAQEKKSLEVNYTRA